MHRRGPGSRKTWAILCKHSGDLFILFNKYILSIYCEVGTIRSTVILLEWFTKYLITSSAQLLTNQNEHQPFTSSQGIQEFTFLIQAWKQLNTWGINQKYLHTSPNDGYFWILGWSMEKRDVLGCLQQRGGRMVIECKRKRHLRVRGRMGRNNTHENTDQPLNN